MTLETLQKVWWYRLIKVLYIIFFLLTFWIPTTIIFNGNKPYLDRDSSYYQLKCTDGTLRGNIKGSDLSYYFKDFNYNDEVGKNAARYACHYTSSSGDDLINIINDKTAFKPLEKNYEVIFKEEVYQGSWLISIGVSLVTLVGTILFLSLIRAIFFYVVVNRQFWRTLFFK